MKNDKSQADFAELIEQLLSQATLDFEAAKERMREAGVSDLKIESLTNAARQEMWAVLLSHLVEVSSKHTRDGDVGQPGSAYNVGVQHGIGVCISNVFSYLKVDMARAGSA